jgi:hypothetical protein
MNFELGENKCCELNERDLVMIFGGGLIETLAFGMIPHII